MNNLYIVLLVISIIKPVLETLNLALAAALKIKELFSKKNNRR